MAEDDPRTALVTRWIESQVGGKVRSVTRQARWRPMWLVDLETDHDLLSLLVRGDRVDSELVFPLAHEMRFQDTAHRLGASVPKVWGWIDEAQCFVMERYPGRPDFAASTDQEREHVVDDYLAALAELHALDVGPFVEAGVERAARPEESADLGRKRFEVMYRRQKELPEPFVEWSLGWLRRHPPRSRGREGPIVWDSGQFHHHDGELVGLVDLELGHIGDPMMDLAGWRMRDSILDFGDFAKLYDRYAELSGQPVDLEAIQLHHIFFTLTNSLAFSHAVKRPGEGSDHATNMQWCAETNLYATEAIAELLGAELPAVEPLEARSSRVGPVHQHLVRSLRAIRADDDLVRHQLRISFRVAQHLARFEEIGDAAVEAELDDVHQLLGRRPADWLESDTELERFVLADDGAHDLELLALFHRRNLRTQMLNGPAGSAMAQHNPIQPFLR